MTRPLVAPLFEPIRIRGLALANRIAMATERRNVQRRAAVRFARVDVRATRGQAADFRRVTARRGSEQAGISRYFSGAWRNLRGCGTGKGASQQCHNDTASG